jgi:hypothetical protein
MPPPPSFRLSPTKEIAEIAKGWCSGEERPAPREVLRPARSPDGQPELDLPIYPDVEARTRILQTLQGGLTQDLSDQELGSALDFIEDAAIEFRWRLSNPAPVRKSPEDQRTQMRKLGSVSTPGRYLQIISSMDQAVLVAVLSRRLPNRPSWSADLVAFALSTPIQKRRLLKLPRDRYRTAVLAAKLDVQAAAKRAYAGEDMVRPYKLRRGQHSTDPRSVFIRRLAAVWKRITRSPVNVSIDPYTRKYRSKFLDFADACIRPFGDKAAKQLGSAIHSITRRPPRRKKNPNFTI